MKLKKGFILMLIVALTLLLVPQVGFAENVVESERVGQINASTVLSKYSKEDFVNQKEFVQEVMSVNDLKAVEEVEEKVEADIENMDKILIPVEYISGVSLESKELKYELSNPYASNKEYFTISENDLGDIYITMTGGECIDHAIFKADGRIFLDGKEVIFSDVEISDRGQKEKASAVANGWTSTFANKGFQNTTSRDYDVPVGNDFQKNVNAGKPIALINATLLGAMIGSAFGGGIGASVGGSLFASLANELIYAAKVYSPDSSYFSMIVSKWKCSAKSNGYQKLFEYNGWYYTKKNFKGHETAHTVYEYSFWSSL